MCVRILLDILRFISTLGAFLLVLNNTVHMTIFSFTTGELDCV